MQAGLFFMVSLADLKRGLRWDTRYRMMTCEPGLGVQVLCSHFSKKEVVLMSSPEVFLSFSSVVLGAAPLRQTS